MSDPTLCEMLMLKANELELEFNNLKLAKSIDFPTEAIRVAEDNYAKLEKQYEALTDQVIDHYKLNRDDYTIALARSGDET